MSIGTSRTKLGIVCRKSRKGRTMVRSRSDRAVAMPRGIPITNVIATATRHCASVSIDSSHMPSSPMPKRAAATPSASFQPASTRPIVATSAIMTGHGMSWAISSRNGVMNFSVMKSLKWPGADSGVAMSNRFDSRPA